MLFAEDEAVVEKEIQNHDDGRSEDKSAGGEDEFVGKREMDGGSDIVGEFVKRGKDAEKLGEAGSDEKSKKCIPDEETDDGMFGDDAIFPSDSGVSDECNYDGDAGGDQI